MGTCLNLFGSSAIIWIRVVKSSVCVVWVYFKGHFSNMMMPWREYKIECVLFNSRIYFTSCEFYFISLCWYANFQRSWAKAKYIKWIRFQLLFQLLTKVHRGMPYICLHNFKKYCIVFASHQSADRKKNRTLLKAI